MKIVNVFEAGQSGEFVTSRDLSEQYFAVRDAVLANEQVQGDALEQIQAQVGAWAEQDEELHVNEPFTFEDYAVPSRSNVLRKFNRLADYLQANHADAVTADEVEASRLFVESSFAMYADTPDRDSIHEDADASFAFVVPTRVSRQNSEYGSEVETIMPVLRYLPNELRAAFAIGLPPSIIDTYNRESDGKRGYLVLAPIFTDMMEDLKDSNEPGKDMFTAAINQINDTIDFAYSRLGAEIQGLGAIIPSLTFYGAHIENKNVITTTGHGGTIQLIMDTLDRAVKESYITSEQTKKIGVLGLGAIGHSIAEIVRDHLPDSEIRVFDARAEKVEKTAAMIGGIAAGSVAEVVRDSEVIISAVTSTIDIKAEGISDEDIEGKLIIDDSQPCSFSPEQVVAAGGNVAWVIGKNGIRRSSYDFGGSMADGLAEVFGCEAEAATIAAKYRDMVAAGSSKASAQQAVREVALNTAVTPQKVKAIAEVFATYNVEAAPLQAFGTYLR